VNSASVLATDAELRDQLAQLREQKGQCARRFGAAKRQGQDLEPLKAEMRAISEGIDRLEAVLRQPPAPMAPQHDTDFLGKALPARFGYRPPELRAPPGLHIVATQNPKAWDAYADAHPASTPYHFEVWRALVCEVMGHSDVSLEARDGEGRIVGILPLIHMRSLLFGKFIVSMPFFNYGGPLADSAAIEDALLRETAVLSERLGVSHAEIREMKPRPGWPARENKVSMVRALPATAEDLDAELGSKLRAQVPRARREEPVILTGGAELVDDFYAVFAENMRDLGTPVYSKRLFHAALAAWPGRTWIVVVRLRGKPVAAGFLVGYRDVLEIPWASTLRRANHLGMNMLLYREILGLAIAKGYAWFDFGRSTEDAGTYRFKKQWNAKSLRHHWSYLLPPEVNIPVMNTNNPKFKIGIRIWKRLPLLVTIKIGPKLVRSIP
jgi:serine/alanine adding enzyme